MIPVRTVNGMPRIAMRPIAQAMLTVAVRIGTTTPWRGPEAQEEHDHEHGQAEGGRDTQVMLEVPDVRRLGQWHPDLERRDPRRRVVAQQRVDPVHTGAD